MNRFSSVEDQEEAAGEILRQMQAIPEAKVRMRLLSSLREEILAQIRMQVPDSIITPENSPKYYMWSRFHSAVFGEWKKARREIHVEMDKETMLKEDDTFSRVELDEIEQSFKHDYITHEGYYFDIARIVGACRALPIAKRIPYLHFVKKLVGSEGMFDGNNSQVLVRQIEFHLSKIAGAIYDHELAEDAKRYVESRAASSSADTAMAEISSPQAPAEGGEQGRPLPEYETLRTIAKSRLQEREWLVAKMRTYPELFEKIDRGDDVMVGKARTRTFQVEQMLSALDRLNRMTPAEKKEMRAKKGAGNVNLQEG
jgi:hypothetical protein